MQDSETHEKPSQRARVLIYTTRFCSYCLAAKAMLDEKNVDYLEVDVEEPEKRKLMVQHSKGRRTVPQIFIDGVHIGGYDEMAALDREAKLDRMLGN